MAVELATDFPRIAADLAKQAVNAMVLDGEIVAADANGKPSFNATPLQNRSRQAGSLLFTLPICSISRGSTCAS